MKFFLFLATALVLFTGCKKQDAGPAAAAPKPHPESISLWSGRTELFLEYPPLIQGEASRFAIHFTRLDNFRPVTRGKVEVRLAYPDGGAQSFVSEGPLRPGIFGVDVRPTKQGVVRMQIHLDEGSFSDEHTIDDVTVHANRKTAAQPHEAEPEETISFLKEQQWTLDFATSVVQPRELRESIGVPAEVIPRSGGESTVTAAIQGRLLAEQFPAMGAHVEKGQLLGRILPQTPAPGDLAALELAKVEAQTALDQARRDRSRAQRVVEAGAAPAKRLEEALALEAPLGARLTAAEARLRQFETTRTAEGGDPSAGFALRAPIAGVVIETHVTPNASVTAGQILLKIVDLDRVYVRASAPESQIQRVRGLSGAELEIPGLERARPAGRVVVMGTVVDPATRTFPVIFETANSDRRLAVNQTLSVRLFLGGSRQALAVPEAAVVDDGGRPVVFIQKEGEAFLRRPVKTGLQQSGLVEIAEGIRPGERVVTKGAYLIRLAALSTQIPAHGHVH